MELLIGAHTSAAGGVHNALLHGGEIGATTIQLFTSNQKQWRGRAFTDEELKVWFSTLDQTGLKKIMSHDSYLINLGCPNIENLNKSRTAFQEEIVRCNQLKLSYLNFHPGASLDGSVEACLDTIVESLLLTAPLLENSSLRLLIEATAGQGSNVGHNFNQLGYLVERTHKHIPIGICIDTCHLFAAGYDVSSYQGWEETLKQFDQLIGINHLCAIHVNDSQHEIGSRKDRHEQLGQGKIGIDGFKAMMTHPQLKYLPKYLETPGGMDEWKKEIQMLRQFAGN